MNISPEHKAILESYGRSVLGAGIAAYSASGGDPKTALNALWAALIPVALRYYNSKDSAFGRTEAK
jgi:hypothetical protein